jgi:heme oxygenase
MSYHSTKIMEILKDATAEQHRDAERRQLQKDMVRGHLPAQTYAAWLGQMFLVHQALWDSIARCGSVNPLLTRIVQDEGLHVSHLRTDLSAFGTDADAVVSLPSTDRAVRSIARMADSDPLSLLGYNYVLEGSMNGNRFIARAMQRTPGITSMSYLDPYGEAQRPTWQAYRDRMNEAGFDEASGLRMVEAARDMFTFVAEMSEELVQTSVTA